MKSDHQTFFEGPTNPLEQQVGKTFFNELPTEPGVYLMYGRSGVGKAKNLRSRLFTYRRVNSDNSSRKVRRLVRMTTEIEVTLCEIEEVALLKENALIRTHKPEFNHANKSPETYYFLTLKPTKEHYEFRLAMQLPEKDEMLDFTYGAFKGHRTIRKGTGALLRHLYLLEYNISTPFDFPTVLTNKLTPLAYKLPVNSKGTLENNFQTALREFLDGQSLDFITQLISHVKRRELFEEYIGRLILKDCESLKQFYDHCLNRNYQLKQKLNLTKPLIPQKKLDDYLIRVAFRDLKVIFSLRFPTNI